MAVYIDEHFAVEIKPRAVKTEQAASEADAEIAPLELEVAQVDIPEGLVNSLKASKTAAKGRFGR